MRPQLVHLEQLCIVLLCLVSVARANDNDDDEQSSREFKRLFGGETSESPLEPEEAQRLIAHQYAVQGEQAIPADPVERAQFQAQRRLLVNLVHFEKFTSNCEGNSFWKVDFVAESIDKQYPALKAYLTDRRDRRLLDSCNRRIVNNLHEYQSRAAMIAQRDKGSNDMLEFTLEPLSLVPALEILGDKSWLEAKNEQVTAALYQHTERKRRHFFKRFTSRSSSKDFRNLFDSTVGRDCRNLPTLVEIIPGYMESYFIREHKLNQLDQTAVNWHKLHRICQSIIMHPDVALEIVSDYKNRQKRESQAEKERCKQHGCI